MMRSYLQAFIWTGGVLALVLLGILSETGVLQGPPPILIFVFGAIGMITGTVMWGMVELNRHEAFIWRFVTDIDAIDRKLEFLADTIDRAHMEKDSAAAEEAVKNFNKAYDLAEYVLTQQNNTRKRHFRLRGRDWKKYIPTHQSSIAS